MRNIEKQDMLKKFEDALIEGVISPDCPGTPEEVLRVLYQYRDGQISNNDWELFNMGVTLPTGGYVGGAIYSDEDTVDCYDYIVNPLFEGGKF